MKNKFYILALSFAFCLGSCNSWLEVKAEVLSEEETGADTSGVVLNLSEPNEPCTCGSGLFE